MSEKLQKETFRCERCGMSFKSGSQLSAHKISSHAVAGGEVTMR
jgi:uncharacterized C2H2 Zn-finger protein